MYPFFSGNDDASSTMIVVAVEFRYVDNTVLSWRRFFS
jgi:hypothetical protein